jgi:hypothetical protein
MSRDGAPADEPLAGGGRTPVFRRGDVVRRRPGPWSSTVVDLLRHLEAVGFSGSPRVVGDGLDDEGWETVTFVEGWTAHPRCWPDEQLPQIGSLLAALHAATSSYRPRADAIWQPWFGRSLGDGPVAMGHCDTGPWNLLARPDATVALIDWETAGPVDPLVELAQACWLNAQLHDDDIAERQGLPSPEARARMVRSIADGYGLDRGRRARLVDLMIEVAVHDAADQARQGGVTPDSQDVEPLWAVAWRVRSAAWMLTHRQLLSRALS